MRSTVCNPNSRNTSSAGNEGRCPAQALGVPGRTGQGIATFMAILSCGLVCAGTICSVFHSLPPSQKRQALACVLKLRLGHPQCQHGPAQAVADASSSTLVDTGCLRLMMIVRGCLLLFHIACPDHIYAFMTCCCSFRRSVRDGGFDSIHAGRAARKQQKQSQESLCFLSSIPCVTSPVLLKCSARHVSCTT